jgi:hypothetical protein
VQVTEAALLAASALAKGSAELVPTFATNGTLASALTALGSYAGSEAVVLGAISLLAQLVVQPDVRPKVLVSDGLAKITSALEAHAGSNAILRYGMTWGMVSVFG